MKFVKRKRKFSGSELATICIWISQRGASDPLVRLCSRLHAVTGTVLSPEGLNKRFNEKSVLFLKHIYPGSGGCAQTTERKIQLEYDLHSGQFLNFQVGPGKNNDKTFGTECLDTLRPDDLCIGDLGYFSLEDLDPIDQRGTYFVSRLKLNTNVYIKKQTEYVKINLQMMMERLLPGETYELGNVYVENQKVLFARLVLYRLTEK